MTPRAKWQKVDHAGSYKIALVAPDGKILELKETRYGTIARAKEAASHQNRADREARKGQKS